MKCNLLALGVFHGELRLPWANEGTEYNSGHILWLNSLFPFRLTGRIRRDEKYLLVASKHFLY